MDMTRTELEEAGFEALQRLYEVARMDTGQAGVVGRFLLGLYNGTRQRLHAGPHDGCSPDAKGDTPVFQRGQPQV